MRARCAASVLLVALGTATAVAVSGAHADDPGQPVTVVETRTVEATYQARGVRWWAARAVLNRRVRNRQRSELAALRRVQARRWAGTVDYGLRLASAVYGVPYPKMRAVAYCESRLDPFAVNGRYKGVLQLGWSPFGFSPFDPVASALSAAQTVVHDGSWRQWTCGGA